MGKFLWVLTAIGSVLGGLVVIIGVIAAHSAPQEAAAAAMGIAFAVIPYCLARATSEMGK
jgi:sugar phosphate permease